MSKRTFELAIRTPQGEVFSCQAVSVRLAAEGGAMQVLARHASLTATVIYSPIVVEGEEFTEEFVARQGVFFFNNQTNSATLLAIYCEKTKEMNKQSIEEYLKFIEEQLQAGKDLSEFQITYLEGEKLAVEAQLKQV